MPSLATRILAPLAFAALIAGCSSFVKDKLPGETTWSVRSLDFDEPLELDWAVLKKTLAVRADVFLIPGQPYNPYRKAEDARRITAFWQSYGYFDVSGVAADVRFDDAAHAIDITWHVDEGPAYTIRDVAVKGAPAGQQGALEGLIDFGAGDRVDLHAYRWHRHAMANHLRRAGWLRAEVYSRAFVDREHKRVDWVYLVDPGPKSVVGKVVVEGNRAIPTEDILARIDLEPGQPVDFTQIQDDELALLDTGAFDTARLFAEYGTEFVQDAIPPDSWIPPDTGGMIPASRVAPDGSLRPREGLDPAVDFTVHIVEAPSSTGRVSAGVGADIERFDVQAGAAVQLRNALGALHHLVFEGDVGYGLRWRGDLDQPLGVYGSALARYVHPGFLARLLDLRVTARFEEKPYPGFHWRSAFFGVGLRSTLTKGLYVDVEPRLRLDWPVGVGTLDPAVRERLDLGDGSDTLNAELAASLTWDARDNGLEALRGHLVALRAAWAPGGALGDTPWLRLEADLRYLINLNADLAIGLRAAGGWALALDDAAGVPIGARLFGGGAYGLRGFGTRRLAAYAERCQGTDCQDIPVGAASLFESAVELRWLPYRQQFGVVAFVDLGGAGEDANPFDDGVSVATGLGLRVRTWSIPLAIDFAYRVTDVPAYGDLDRFFVFARIGEAF
ncbi:MAG: hypothetical protein EP329_20785 [Deltaproteobacteria bacterium]|nr:MAG: hypothetical protein EP329_20785 [Deltaproteobacteria bacterium]